MNGQLHGRFRRWPTNGELAEEVHHKEGQPDGLAKAYFASGFLKSNTRVQSGKVVEKRFWADGEHKESLPTLTVP